MGKRSSLSLVAGSVALSITILLCGCRKEPTKPSWDVDLVVPLVRTTMGIGDLIADSLLSTDANGNVSLLYSSQLFALKLDTILAAPDTNFRYVYKLDGFSITVTPGVTFSATNDITRFDLQDLDLRELRVRSGHVGLEMVNRIGTSIIGNFQLPGATLNGTPLALQVIAPPGSAADPSHFSEQHPLDGYDFDMRGPLHNDVNTLATSLSYTSDPNGTAVMMGPADSLEAFVSYSGIVPQYARGFFGTRLITIEPDTTRLDLFHNISGLLDVDVATARLKVRNGLGVDARANIAYIRAINSNTGTVVDLQHAITSSPLNLDRAIDLGGSFQSALNAYTLTTANSNIDQFIENLPDGIAFAMDVTIDPLGDVSNGNDFFYYESTLSADLEVEVPLRLIATDIALSRTTTVTLPGTLEAHAFRSGTLHFFATNGFPFSAAIHLDIVNGHGDPLASLLPGGTIAPASLGVNGLVSSATDSEVHFDITAEQLDLLYADGRLRIGAIFNTASQTEHVQLRSDYKLDVQVTLDGNYMVNGDE